MVRFPNAAQRRQRALIKAVSVRSLQSVAIALFVCIEAPILSLFAGIAHYGITGADHVDAYIRTGCAIARATVHYAVMCGAN